MKMIIHFVNGMSNRCYSARVEGETLSDCISKAEETFDPRDYYLSDWEYIEY